MFPKPWAFSPETDKPYSSRRLCNILKWKGELDCQACYGDRQITAQCSVTNQPDLEFLGLDWLNELKLLKWIKHFIAEKSSVAKVTKRKTSSKRVRKRNKNDKKNSTDLLIKHIWEVNPILERPKIKRIKSYDFLQFQR